MRGRAITATVTGAEITTAILQTAMAMAMTMAMVMPTIVQMIPRTGIMRTGTMTKIKTTAGTATGTETGTETETETKTETVMAEEKAIVTRMEAGEIMAMTPVAVAMAVRAGGEEEARGKTRGKPGRARGIEAGPFIETIFLFYF